MGERYHFRLTNEGRLKVYKAINDRGTQKEVLKSVGPRFKQSALTTLLGGGSCSDRKGLRLRLEQFIEFLELDPADCIEDCVPRKTHDGPSALPVPASVQFKALIEYYRHSLSRAGLAVYSCSVAGTKFEWPVAVRPEWLNLAVPLTRKNETCRIRKGAFSAASLGNAANRPLKKYAALWKQHLANTGGREWNAPLFWLQSMELTRTSLSAEFALTDFYAYKYSVGLLETELVTVLRETRMNIPRTVRSLNLRDALLKDPSQLLNHTRSGSSGCLVLVAMARGVDHNDYLFLLQERSSRVTDQAGLLSVIPQGFHQPCQKGVGLVHDWEALLSQTVLREVYEEIFGGEERVGRPVPSYSPDDFHDSDAVRWLAEHPQAWTMELVGHGCHLMAGERDFAVLFAIHDPAFWESFYKSPSRRADCFKYCWESDDQVDCVSSTDRNRLVSLLRDRAWTGEGPFALIEGLKRLHQIDPSRCIDSLS